MLVQHLQAAWWKTTSAFITYIDYWIQTIQQRTPDSSNMTSSACPCTHPMLTGRLSRHAFLRSTTPNIYSQYWKCISQNFVYNSSLTNIPAIHIYIYVTPSLQIFPNPSPLFKSDYPCPSNSTQYGTHADLNSITKSGLYNYRPLLLHHIHTTTA